MQVLEIDDNESPTFAGQRFVIELVAPGTGPVRVKSCEVIGNRYRNRYSFPASLAVSDVFVKALTTAVMAGVSSASPSPDVVAMPDLTVEIAGLTLSKAHVITHASEDGRHGVTLRFKTVLGCITNAFLPKLGIEDTVSDYSAHMSAMVLTDIVMPLLDLCSIVEEEEIGNAQAFDHFLGTLAQRSREVRFQAELIKRFVTSAPGPNDKGRRVSTGEMFMKAGGLG